MNIFLLIFFLIIGIAGLFYHVDAGVFIGLGLTPWQIIKMRKPGRVSLAAILITGIAGVVYFALSSEWLFLGLFIFIQLYNYWGQNRLEKGTGGDGSPS